MDERPPSTRDEELIDAARRQAGRLLATSSSWGASPAATPSADALGAVSGYRIVREIRRGGQGVVCEALPDAGGPPVAIKFLREPGAADAQALARFRREIGILRQLRHPAIVALRDSGVEAGRAETAEELHAQLEKGLGSDGPYVIDAVFSSG